MTQNPASEGLYKVLNVYLETKEQIEMKIQKIRSAIEVLESDQEFLRQLNLLAEKNIATLIQSPVDPLYPINAKIFEKLEYFNESIGRFWTMNQFKEFVSGIEGDKSEKTLKNIAQKFNKLMNSRDLICVKYGGSNKYSYYTTSRDWIEKKEMDGRELYNIKPGFEPPKEDLQTLNENQKSPLNMRWKGII